MQEPGLELLLLGPLQISIAGKPLSGLVSLKAKALLAYLAAGDADDGHDDQINKQKGTERGQQLRGAPKAAAQGADCDDAKQDERGQDKRQEEKLADEHVPAPCRWGSKAAYRGWNLQRRPRRRNQPP